MWHDVILRKVGTENKVCCGVMTSCGSFGVADRFRWLDLIDVCMTKKGNVMTAHADVLSIQLYSLRNLGDIGPVLETAARAGFRHVELVGAHLGDAEEVRKKLDGLELKASSSHVGMDQLRERPDAMLEAASVLDITELYMPAVPDNEREMEASGWRALGLELGHLSERFLKQGVRLGYHNHHWELALKEGQKTALELIFEATGSSPLAWQADVAWLVRGGVEPRAWLKRYSDRLQSVHVKDIAWKGEALEEDGWADVGHGILDWPALWQHCRDHGAGWMIAEHDKPADPGRFANRSYQFLTSMEG